jgi:hypothetical protein
MFERVNVSLLWCILQIKEVALNLHVLCAYHLVQFFCIHITSHSIWVSAPLEKGQLLSLPSERYTPYAVTKNILLLSTPKQLSKPSLTAIRHLPVGMPNRVL